MSGLLISAAPALERLGRAAQAAGGGPARLRSGRRHRRHNASAVIASGRLRAGLRSGRRHRRHNASAVIAPRRMGAVPPVLQRRQVRRAHRGRASGPRRAIGSPIPAG
jgi:hypothetical protein